jgi:hypothetical protein
MEASAGGQMIITTKKIFLMRAGWQSGVRKARFSTIIPHPREEM